MGETAAAMAAGYVVFKDVGKLKLFCISHTQAHDISLIIHRTQMKTCFRTYKTQNEYFQKLVMGFIKHPQKQVLSYEPARHCKDAI